ncbi:MAG: hypothetical protein VX278_03250 [Myxococcota bacterium]|nr:hypothetical protein [Myxococcota bacterium]
MQALVFLLFGCLISSEEHNQTITDLESHLSVEDTAEPVTSPEPELVPLPPSTKALFFSENDSCIVFENTAQRSDLPLNTNYWSFSFVLTEPLIGFSSEEGRNPPKMITFSRGNSYLALQIDLSENLSTLFLCGEDEACTTQTFSIDSLSVGDRITFSFGNEVLAFYRNDIAMASFEGETPFAEEGTLRFGCTPESITDSNVGWASGIDTLVLIRHPLTPEKMEELSTSNSPNLVWSDMQEVHGFWNLGENGPDSIVDLRGDCDGIGYNLQVRDIE